MQPQNVNWIRDVMYVPWLPKRGDIEFVGFYRRKPRGFSNGHYLQCNPQAYTVSKSCRNNYIAYYGGGFLFFNGLFAYVQWQKGKWFWTPWTPQFMTDATLKEFGYKV